MSRFLRRAAHFPRRAEGSVAIMFGLASVAMILAVGLAVDYGRIDLAKTRLQEAADSAVLSAVSLQLAPGADSATQAATLRQNAIARFNALALQQGVAIATVTATASSAPNAPAVSLTFTGSIPAAFGELVGIDNYAPTGTSGATAAAAGGPMGGPPKFIDIYFLVDISGSMGIGATAPDQLLMSKTKGMDGVPGPKGGGCVFACHQQPDYNLDALAHKAGAVLRIDVVKQGLEQIVSAAQAASVANGETMRLALVSYATNAQTNVGITSNYASVANGVASLQLAGYDAGTSTYAALQYVQSQISAHGDGSSASKPLVYVLLATDGTSDSVENIPPSPYWTESATFYPPYSNDVQGSPFPHAAISEGQVPSELEGVDPAWCDPLKSMGATVMTLEMPYMIPDVAIQENEGATDRFQYIQNTLLPIIPAQMTACASQPSYHVSATSPSQILAAMNSLFALTQATAESVPRLTN